jgi:hypothetical protein
VLTSQVRSTADRKKVCIVDKHRRDNMAPLLWYSFCSSLLPTDNKSLTAIRSPDSNIIKHVRSFALWQSDDDDLNKLEQASITSLRLFLTALPSNRLIDFRSNKAMDIDTFQTLLQTHREIQSLRVPLYHPAGQSSLHNAPSIQPYLSNLKSLEVNLEGDHDNNEVFLSRLDTCRIIVRHAHNLTHLNIQTPRWQQRQSRSSIVGNMVLSIDAHPILTKLKHLSLSYIDFTSCTAVLHQIDFRYLETLRIKHCNGEDVFLSMIVSIFEQHESRLEILEIGAPDPRADPYTYAYVNNVERLLSSFTGLKELYIDFGGLTGAVRGHRIARHAATLEVLCVGSAHGDHILAHDTLTPILTKCSNLVQLGLSLDPVDLVDMYKPGLQPLGSDMVSILDLGAAHPTLRTFRVLDTLVFNSLTNSREPYQKRIKAASAATLAQNFAKHIVSHLMNNGSNIKLLSLSRYRIRDERSDEQDLYVDADGQRYPRYTYEVQKVAGRLSRMQVFALPLASAELELSEENTFGHKFERWPLVSSDDRGV